MAGKGVPGWIWGIALLLGVLLAFWFALPQQPASVVRAVQEGERAPKVHLPGVDGSVVPWPKGKVVLVNFWATWCPPCREETPSLVALYERFKDQGLVVLGISVDRDDRAVREFVQRYGVSYPVLRDPDASTSHAWGVFKYPETFIVDRNGIVRHHLIGAVNWMDQAVVEAIERLLARSAG